MEQKISAYDSDSGMSVELTFEGPTEIDEKIWARLLQKLEQDHPELIQESQGEPVPAEELEKMDQRHFEKVRYRQEAVKRRRERLPV